MERVHECESNDLNLVRNICILAHVDHGKTTLADHLIASYGGGVLHRRQAGRIRFMDYLDEEQRRAITMKSSSISLQFRNHFINLIDSPGHMDFCSEVSAAARLSDGALILVDVVEGVHIQTHAVIRQAFIEKLTPCLVLNKIDRLFFELKLKPMEAYERLLRIIHEVNWIVSAYRSEEYLCDVDSIASSTELNHELIEDDMEDTFQPQKGNVVFTCGLDGWGFGVRDFAELYASKLGASSAALLKGLWGTRYFNEKTKMIIGKKKAIGSITNPRPMFVQFVLEELWKVFYASSKGDAGRKKLEELIKSFSLSVPLHNLQNRDPKAVLQAFLSCWLPLSDAVLSMVVKCVPNPVTAQSSRISRLLPMKSQDEWKNEETVDTFSEAELVRQSVEACDCSPSAPCVAFVSKMFAVPISMLPPGEPLDSWSDDSASGECFLAFARIFSGVFTKGQRVFVLSSLYDPTKVGSDTNQKHVQEAVVMALYLMMGQGLKPITTAKAGSIVAIRGLGQSILKNATLSSTMNSWPFSSMVFQVSPTLKVAIEPSDPGGMGALIEGLRLLNRADPFVEVTVSPRGEHVLAVAGEVHLERCITDLKERFAKVSLEISPPLVSYKETIQGEMENLCKLLDGTSNFVERTTPNGRCTVRVRVMKLPTPLTELLDRSSELLGEIFRDQTMHGDGNPTQTLKKRIIDAVENDEVEGRYKQVWEHFFRRMWSLAGPNILLTPERGKTLEGAALIRGTPHVSERLGFCEATGDNSCCSRELSVDEEMLLKEARNLESSVVSGFQLATSSGPLCEEPMWGLAFDIEAVLSPGCEKYGLFAGQVVNAVKEACRAAVLQGKPRLVEAWHVCKLNAPVSTEYSGSTYAVLTRRRARFIKEGQEAYIPVGESLGLADELRRCTSGASSARLVFSHWETLAEDPFFVPDGSSVARNLARKLIDDVRRRKGLPIEEKVVQHATKQRTLARKV